MLPTVISAEEIEAASYGAIWGGQKSGSGAAIVAKGEQPIQARKGLPDDPDNARSQMQRQIRVMLYGETHVRG